MNAGEDRWGVVTNSSDDDSSRRWSAFGCHVDRLASALLHAPIRCHDDARLLGNPRTRGENPMGESFQCMTLDYVCPRWETCFSMSPWWCVLILMKTFFFSVWYLIREVNRTTSSASLWFTFRRRYPDRRALPGRILTTAICNVSTWRHRPRQQQQQLLPLARKKRAPFEWLKIHTYTHPPTHIHTKT